MEEQDAVVLCKSDDGCDVNADAVDSANPSVVAVTRPFIVLIVVVCEDM